MASFQPRGPYSKEELSQLYPKGLELQQVQILLRHGERSPVSARFRNAGLHPYWPYCNAARRLSSAVMSHTNGSSWDHLHWRRRLETFGQNDEPLIAKGPSGETDGICQAGELTDKGRETTLALGERLRHLYVDQLNFMPQLIADTDTVYLRATPMPRALESVQQSFWGMYPSTARAPSFQPPTIVTRAPADETLFPNQGNCRRFNQLSEAFGQRTADRWNKSDQMRYLNKLIGKWMPQESPNVAVDSHPRLSGIMDTVNASLSHGKATRLPNEFYDDKARRIIDQIAVEEWFSGYNESQEYRSLGIGSLVGDIVSRLIVTVEEGANDGTSELDNKSAFGGTERNVVQRPKFAMSGCHDTTLAGLLTSFDAFKDEPWPPFTSHVAIELFKQRASASGEAAKTAEALPKTPSHFRSWLSLFSSTTTSLPSSTPSSKISRRPLSSYSPREKTKLDGYYVRVRYNDRPLTIPGCRTPGSHLDGDESFCTLEAFKRIADSFTPKNWKEACNANLDKPPFPTPLMAAGE